jgi:hypothetical protein
MAPDAPRIDVDWSQSFAARRRNRVRLDPALADDVSNRQLFHRWPADMLGLRPSISKAPERDLGPGLVGAR